MAYQIKSLPESYGPPKPKKFLQKVEAGEEINEGGENPLVSGVKEVAKTAARLPFRAAETIAGAPADLAQFASQVGNVIPSLFGAGVTPEEQEIIRNYQRESGALPTSAELKEKTHKALPFTKSEPGSFSEKAERATEVLTSLALPGFISKVGGAVKAGATGLELANIGKEAVKHGFKKDIKKVLGSEAAGWLSKQLGASEGQEAGVRMGTLVLSQLFGGRAKVQSAASEGYEEARNLAKDAERVNAKGFQKDIHGWLNRTKEGSQTSGKEWVKNEANLLHEKLKDGKMGVNDAIQFTQDIRKKLRDGEVPREVRHYAYDMIDKLKGHVIDPYSKLNPKFGKTFSEANEAWAALNKENAFSNFVRENLYDKPFASKIVSGLLHGAGAGAAHLVSGAAIPVGLGTFGAHQSYRFLDLLKRSAIARDVYGKLVKASLAGNVAAASKLATNLDQVALKYEEQHPDEESKGAWVIKKL